MNAPRIGEPNTETGTDCAQLSAPVDAKPPQGQQHLMNKIDQATAAIDALIAKLNAQDNEASPQSQSQDFGEANK